MLPLTEITFNGETKKKLNASLATPTPEQRAYTFIFSSGSMTIPYSSVGAIGITMIPFENSKIVIELKKGVVFEGVKVKILKGEMQLSSAGEFQRILKNNGHQGLVKEGKRTASALLEPPFSGVYNWYLRTLIKHLLSFLQILITVGLIYEFISFFPTILEFDIFQRILELKDILTPYLLQFNDAYPILFKVVSISFLLVSWPLFIPFVSVFLVGYIGVKLARFLFGVTIIGHCYSVYRTIRYYVKMFTNFLFGIKNILQPKKKKD